MTINLKPFCANVTDPREYLRAPFKVGEWVYATNGHMAIRVKADNFPDMGEVADHKAKVPKAIGGLFERALKKAGGAFQAMPASPPLKPCRDCRGCGEWPAVQCDDCDGEGQFRHGAFWYDCKNCEGSFAGAGFIRVSRDGQRGEMRPCITCDGLGYVCGDGRDNPPRQLGDAFYNAAYLYRMSLLPQVRVFPGDPAPVRDCAPAVFIFDGGHALLMPYLAKHTAPTDQPTT